jgi:hypothetical protein
MSFILKTFSEVKVFSSSVNTTFAKLSLISEESYIGSLSINLSNSLIVSFWVYWSISASNATSADTSGASMSLTEANVFLVGPSLKVSSKSSKEGTILYLS